MRIAYVSTDEVDQALAARIAAECGAVVCNLLPHDPPPDGLFDAVLYNLDDVPRDRAVRPPRGVPPRQTGSSHGGPRL